MKRRNGSVRRWALVIAAIILLPLIALRLQLKWRLHRELKALRAEGTPTTWKELAAADDTIPPEQNAGPGLINIFQQLPQHPLQQSSNIPVVGLVSLPPPGEPWPESMRTATDAYLKSLQPGFAGLYETLKLPRCQYPREDSKSDFGIVIHWWAQLKATAAKLSLESAFSLDQGDWLRAARANKAQFQLADTLYAEPFWVDQLIRDAVAAVAVESCQRLLGSEGVDARELVSLRDVIRNDLTHTSLNHVIAGERVYFLESVRPENGPLPLDFDARYTGGWSEYQDRFKVMLYRISGLADEDELWYLANSRKLESDLGSSLRAQQAVVDGWSNYQPAASGPYFCRWSKQMTAVNDRAIAHHLRMHAQLRAALAAIAVTQYRLKYHGELPATLDSLVPEFLDAVPVEPQSDKPFELIRTREGYGIGRGSPVFTVNLTPSMAGH